MKKVILLPLLLLLGVYAFAQAPLKFSYQAIARNTAGDPLENQAIGVRISILNNTSTGTLLYRETHTTTTNQFGLFTLEIGGGTVVNGAMNAIDWGLGDKFLRVDFDPNGGTSYTNMGATQLLSVPYALYAGNSASNWTLTGNNIWSNNAGNVGIGTNVPGSKLEVQSNSSVTTPNVMVKETETGDYSRISLGNANSNKSWTLAGLNADGSNTDQFNLFHSTAGDIMKVGQNGTVLIGTLGNPNDYSPKLSVSSSTPSTAAFYNFGDSASHTIIAQNDAIAGRGVFSTVSKPFSVAIQAIADSSTMTGVEARSAKGTGARAISTKGLPLHVERYQANGTVAKFINGKVVISNLASDTATEKLDVKGAVRIGNTALSQSGTIRYTGADFEGNVGGTWTSLTSGTGGPSLWVQNGDSMTTANANARIALGTSAGVDDIHVRRNSAGVRLQATSANGNSSVNLINSSLMPFQITKKGNYMFQSFFGRLTYNSAIINNDNGNMFIYTGDTLLFGNNSNLHSAFVPNGNLGVGTTSPTAKLEVAGQVKITGGSPGAGKVLTSNAQGLATWQTPATYTAGTGISIAGNTITNAAPDQIITLTGVGATNVTGTYPNFTITSTDNNTTYTAGTGLSLAGTVFSAQNTTALWNANQLQGRGVASTLPANGDVLTYNGTNWVPQAPSGGGGGGGQWTTSGSNIYNNNAGSVLVGTSSASSANGTFEATANNSFGTVASLYNTSSSYMTILNVKDNATSGNPSGCVGCTGNAAIKASSTYGDALFASSSNGRGIFLSGGSSFNPAMQIEVNPGATTALELAGQIKITAGNPGAGKVLTSDATGLATWQTPSGGGGGSGWNFDGTNAFNSTFATGGKIAIGTNNPFPSYSLTVTGNTNNNNAAYFSAFNASSNALVTATGNVGIGTPTPGAKLEVNGQVKITGGSPGAGKVLTSDANGLATWETPSGGGGGSGWLLTGNSGTTSSNFIGTTDAQPIRLKANNAFVGEINPAAVKMGSVSIGANSNTLGSQTIAIGYGAGQTNANNGSVAVGYDAFKNSTSFSSIGIGLSAGINAQNFYNSLAVGEEAASDVTDAQYCTFIGKSAGANSGNSFESNYLGRDAGRYTSGNENTFIGTKAGQGYNAASTGNNNTFVGNESFLTFLNGNFNTSIGAQTMSDLVYPTMGVTLLGAKSKINVGSVMAKNNITVIGYEAEGEIDNTVIIGKNADIGIGTSTPAAKTHVSATSTVTYPQLLLNEATTGFSRLTMNNAGSTNRWTIASHADNSNAAAFFNIFYSGTGTNLFSIQGNGNAVLAGTLTQSSDRRLKTNIQQLNNALSRVEQLNGYTYNWKEELKKDAQTQIGLIAQEVEAIFPEVVNTDESGIKSVAYQNLVPVLIEALKEQQKQINELKSINLKYESKVDILETKLDQIMNKLNTLNLTETTTTKE